MKLYLEKDLAFLKKRLLINRAIYILSIAAILVTLILGLIFSSYDSKNTSIIICSVINGILSLFVIFFIAFARKIKRFIFEYESLMDAKSRTIKCKVIKVSDKPISLADKSMCYEVTISENKEEKTLFLSEVFDKGLLNKPGKYRFVVAFDYITEIYYEN